MNDKRVAVVVAHPDDEVLAFGGTIARHADSGDIVRILILATGAAARDGDQAIAIEALRKQAQAATTVMGAASVTLADFPDNRMDTVGLLDVVRRIESFLKDYPAGTIYTHHDGDLNVDHRIAHKAVLTACRPLPGATTQRILTGEVLSSTEWTAPAGRFVPNIYIGIGDQLERKLTALHCYESEVRAFPHPRSPEALRALATLRGSECGLDAAESFALIRDVRA